MAKGFKDSSGKFHPTGNKGTSSKQKSIQPDGSRIKNIKHKVWKFDDAPDDVQEKIIEKLRQEKFEFGDDFFTQDEGLIYDEDEKKGANDIGLKTAFPEHYDVSSNRGTDFVQFDLEIEDEDKFAKYLGIDKKLQDKINFRFMNDNKRDPDNTTLEIITPSGEVVDTNTEDESLIADSKFEVSPKEFTKIFNAIIKFDNLMSATLRHLTDNFEDQFTDERLEEEARDLDYDFDEDGGIV